MLAEGWASLTAYTAGFGPSRDWQQFAPSGRKKTFRAEERGMICHVVLYRMKPGKTERDEERLLTEARRKLPKIPGVSNLRAGRSIRGSENGYSVGLVADFPDAAALEAYRVNTDHQSFVREIAEPLVDDVWRFDFQWE